MIAAVTLLSLLLGAPQSTVSATPSSPKQGAAPNRISRTYRISGVVVDSISGATVSRARVSISLASGFGDPFTIDANNGSFSFEDVPSGQKYRLSAAAPGYVAQSYNAHEGFTSDIAVGEGLDSEHLVFRLSRQAVVFGIVSDDRGEPVRNAQVILLNVIKGRRTPSTQAVDNTNDVGEYRFAHLLPGKYFVAVQAQPWYAETRYKYAGESDANISAGIAQPKYDPLLDVVYPITFYPAATDPHSSTELDITAGEKREADVQLSAVPSVHVRVTNLPADSVFSVDLKADQSSLDTSGFDAAMGYPVQSIQVAPGELEVAGLPPGGGTLTILEHSSGNEGGIQKTIHATLDGSTVDASGGVANPTISGQVLFQDHSLPSDSVEVFLTGNRHSGVSARVQKDGTFSFESSRPEPGTYTVEVTFNRSSAEAYVQHISGTGAKIEGRQISIESGGSAQLTITVGHGIGKINGVAKLDGNPLGGAMILLIPESSENLEADRRMAESDSDGTFALGGIIPGKYLLMAIQDGWNLDWTDLQALQLYREKAQRLEITPGQELKVELDVQRVTTAQPTQ